MPYFFLFQLVKGIVTVLVNLYFLVIISIQASFRNVDTYPVALQAFIALVFVGFTSTLEAIVHFWYFWTNEPDGESHENTILYCVCTFGFSHMNEISTPMIMLGLAIQRFFKVCKPFVSNRPEFRTYQLWGNVILTILPCFILTIHVVAVVYVYRYNATGYLRQVCYSGFFWNTTYRATIGGAIFFYIPVMICAVLYVFVGKSLMAMTTMEARNRQLSIIFMTSCVLWFLFWLPERIMKQYYANNESILGKSKLFHFFFNRHNFFTQIFSFLQPVVILISYRPLQEPIINFYKKSGCQMLLYAE